MVEVVFFKKWSKKLERWLTLENPFGFFFVVFLFFCLFPFWNTTGDPARLLGAGGPFHALAQSDAVGRRRRRPTDADAGDVTGGRAAAAAAAAAAGAVDAQRRTGKGGNAHRRPRHPLLKVQTRKKNEREKKSSGNEKKQTNKTRTRKANENSILDSNRRFVSVRVGHFFFVELRFVVCGLSRFFLILFRFDCRRTQKKRRSRIRFWDSWRFLENSAKTKTKTKNKTNLSAKHAHLDRHEPRAFVTLFPLFVCLIVCVCVCV